MNEFKKASIDQELKGQAQQIKGKLKQGAGAVAGRPDWQEEGLADQDEGEIRETAGSVGRKLSDLAGRAADKLRGKG